MKITTIKSKQSNSGSIHDLASDTSDRQIKIPATAEYVIILAAYYGGKGYSTHATADSAAKKAKILKKDKYSFEVFRADGSHLEWDGFDLRSGDSSRDLA